MSRIPIAGPWITDSEVELVTEAVRTAWYGKANKYTAAFEEEFATYCGRNHAIALPSCTSGLHLVLAALGVGEGDEVIVPDLTWIASAAPITYVGATPVFVDVDIETWCLSAAAVERALSPRTKAIIAVDLYGGLPDMDALLSVADRQGLPVIEDAAEAIGSRYRGSLAGSFGIASVFSFHGSKTLTTGEGGMVVTDDFEVRDRMLVLRDHGRVPGDSTFFNAEIGFKYKMSAVQAALGLAQLRRIDQLVARKREIFAWYSSRLDDVCGLTLNVEPLGTENSYWMTTIVLDRSRGMTKEALGARLSDQEIDSRPFFHPLSSLPAYTEAPGIQRARERNVNSYSIGPYGLNLPSALSLVEEDVDRVCEVLIRSLQPG